MSSPTAKQPRAKRAGAAKEPRHQSDFDRAITDNLGEGVYALDQQGRLTFMNPAAERMLGWTAAELLGRNIHDAIHFQHADGTPAARGDCPLLDVLESKCPASGDDDVLTRKDGEMFPVSYISSPVIAEGEVVGAVVAFRDITERQRVEQELEHQSNLNKTITDNAASCLFMMDKEGRPTFMNPAAEDVTGYTLEEIRDRPLHEAVHYKRPDGSPYPMSECPIDNASAELVAVREQEEIFVRKDGTLFPVAYSVAPLERDGETIGAVLEFRDTTELKRAEAELREQKETVETINRIGRLIAAELDLHKIVQAVTDAATELTGAHFGSFFYNVLTEEGASYMLYTLSGVPAEAFAHFPMPRATDLFGPTFRGEGVLRIADVRKDPRYGKNSPYYGMPEGHLPVTSYLAVPVSSRTDEVLGGLFFGHPDENIFSERDERLVVGLAAQAAIAIDNARLYEAAQRARRQAEASEQRYRALTDSMPQLVWATDAQGSHFYYNQRWYDFTGLTEEESMGFGFADALHPDDKERTLKCWESAWRDGESYEIEYRFYSRPLKQYRWFLGRATPVREASGKITQWVGTCTEIDEQKQMEERLAQLNREREQMLEEVSTPLVPVWEGVLVLPIVGSLDTARMQQATEAALAEVRRKGARACIIDITGARLMDSHAVANLSNLVSALRLIGADGIVTGIGAHAAQSLVGLGLDLKGMRTYRTLAQALAALIKTPATTISSINHARATTKG